MGSMVCCSGRMLSRGGNEPVVSRVAIMARKSSADCWPTRAWNSPAHTSTRGRPGAARRATLLTRLSVAASLRAMGPPISWPTTASRLPSISLRSPRNLRASWASLTTSSHGATTPGSRVLAPAPRWSYRNVAMPAFTKLLLRSLYTLSMGAPTVLPSRLVRPGLGTISTAGTGPLAFCGRVRVPLMWTFPTPVNCRIFSVAGFSKLLPASGSSFDPPPPPPQATAARASPATATSQRRRAPTAPMSVLPCSTSGRGAGTRTCGGGVRGAGLGDVEQQVVEGVALQALLLHEGVGQLVEGGPVGGEHRAGPVLGLGQDGLGLGVDLGGDALGVAHPHLALVAVGEGLDDEGAELGGHAEVGHHAPGQGAGLLEVGLRARAELAGDDLLGHPATHHGGDAVQQLGAGDGQGVALGHVPGEAPGVAPGHDGQLAHPVGAGQGGGGHRVAGLVEGDAVAVLGRQDAGVALGAGHHTLDGLEHVLGLHLGGPPAGGEEGGLVDHVGQIGAAEAYGALGHRGHVDLRGQRLAPGVDLEHALTAPDVGTVDAHPAVEATGAQQGGVQDV